MSERSNNTVRKMKWASWCENRILKYDLWHQPHQILHWKLHVFLKARLLMR